MDPLSITAATIGISGAAMASIVGVRNTINNIQDAEKVVGDIRTQLENIRRPLDSLKELRITNTGTLTASKNALARSGVAEAVNDCGKACAAFDRKLQKWTKHSPDGKLSFRDKMTVGVWNKEKVITFKTRVETCQSSVQFAVSSVQLLVCPCPCTQVRRSHNDSILQQKQMSHADAGYERLSQQMQSLELQASEQITLFKEQQEQLEQRQQELALHSDSDDKESAEQYAAANEVKEQARLLDDSQVSLAIAFAQLKAARTNQEIGNVLTDKKSFALVGIPESVVGKINQRIGNVSTTDEASAAVGVFDKDVDMRNFFKRA
jgi:hypothetical protein